MAVPESLDKGSLPAACGFRCRCDECLFPLCKVRERISKLMPEKGSLVHGKHSIMAQLVVKINIILLKYNA